MPGLVVAPLTPAAAAAAAVELAVEEEPAEAGLVAAAAAAVAVVAAVELVGPAAAAADTKERDNSWCLRKRPVIFEFIVLTRLKRGLVWPLATLQTR